MRGTLGWARVVASLMACAALAPTLLSAQPAPKRIVAIGDSVRVYAPTRAEGSVVSAGPLGLVVRTPQAGNVTFEPQTLGRFEVYTGWIPRRGRIIEGTLIGLGAGLVPTLPLIGQCENSCAFTGVALLGGMGALLGGLIGGTTAGPQWRLAILPPDGDAAVGGGIGVDAGAGGGLLAPATRITLLRVRI
ncbi:MAG: hypothetical protein ABFS34_15420 [Gemmatimonadota bacterium]